MNSKVIQLNNTKRVSIILMCLALILSAYFLVLGGQKVSAASPEVITTPQQLDDIRHDMEGDYILGNDIDLDVAPYNSGAGWDPIGGENDNVSFKGTFDGDGHKITGLMIDLARGGGGLFGSAAGSASFSNVNLVGVDVKAWSSVGGLVRGLGNGGLIENVQVTGTVSSTNNNEVGGVAGNLSNAKIKDSSFEGTVSGTSGFGTGGLVGSAGGTGAIIENSTSSGTVSSTGRTVGGLAGKASNVINSSSTANVSSTHVLKYENQQSSVGGLVGSFSPHGGEITDSFATGNVEATNGGGVGGLAGYVKGNVRTSIKNTYATGTVTGDVNVGGLVGYNNNTVISDSYATGEVFGKDDIGGLIGHLFEKGGLIEKSYTESKVIATGDNVGGLVGSTKDAPKIVDAYARGSVKGKDNVGGLVGFNPAATIHRSYATGKVVGQDELGGIVGKDVYGKFSPNAPNYYDKQRTTMTDTVGGTGDTTANMQIRSTFNGWNFTSTWKLEQNDYPILRDQPFDDLTDVSSSHWGRDDITEIVEIGIMGGSPDYDNPGKFIFKPADQITRAEFAIVIVNALGETATSMSTGFGDDSTIPVWAKKEVAKAKELNIVEGDQNGNFNPSNKISRAEIATMIARAYDLSATPGQLPDFLDKASIPTWAKNEVEAIVASGVMQGQDQAGHLYFAPKASAQRVEAGLSALRAYKLD